MLFSSNEFIFLFLPAALLGYHLLGRFGRVPMMGWLTLTSLFFYGYWNPRYLLLLVASILLNFGCARVIALSPAERAKTFWLTTGVVTNIALLMWFKYLFPLLHFIRAAGWTHHEFGDVLLPLGISFFTFTQIAYLIDLRQTGGKPEGLLEYTLFVTFFPHLIAGPIIHHGQMMPQFKAQRHSALRADDMAVGVSWFLLGLGKKVLIADHFGLTASVFYAQPHAFGAQATWVGVLSYAIQLYFDFSGYSDMAMGLARMFSLTFPLNFNSPYKAASIIDFWQRWHITLTNYITTYVYNPLQIRVSSWRMDRGKKVSRKAQATPGGFAGMVAFPLLCTLLVAGVWHGAGLKYAIYGLLHGAYLTVNHAWRLFGPKPEAARGAWVRRATHTASVLLTLAAVLVSQAFFRAESTGAAVYTIGSLLGLHGGAGLAGYADSVAQYANFTGSSLHAWGLIALVFAVIWGLPNTQQIMGQVEAADTPTRLRWQPNAVWGLGLMGMTALTLMVLYLSTSFLYFQF